MRFCVGLAVALALSGCTTVPFENWEDDMPVTDVSVPAVTARAETVAVASVDDAADDPALLMLGDDLIFLGTDKRAGLYAYALDGSVKQFLPVGRLNNVDLRALDERRALAVASNRSNSTISVFTATADEVVFQGDIRAIRSEPYGICMGATEAGFVAAIAHKGGQVDLYTVEPGANVTGAHYQTVEMDIQLEGCVFDEANEAFFVGREEQGIYRFDLDLSTGRIANESEIDRINGPTGTAADIEGLALYDLGDGKGYLIASSQGNNTFAVYDRQTGAFLGRFRITDDASTGVDGAEETDGLDALSAPLPGYPRGILVVQDGFNFPRGDRQNYKIIDWRQVERVLDL